MSHARCCLNFLALLLAAAAHAAPPLRLLPALTDLSVAGWAQAEHIINAVSQCASLRRLSLRSVVPRTVHSVLLSPAVGAKLEHLFVGGFDVGYVDGHERPAARVDWAAAFANATAMRSLDIEGSHDVDALLLVIGAHCAQLQSLRIRFAWPLPPEALGSTVPSPAALAALLAALPSLRSVALSMRPLAVYTSLRSVHDRASAAEEWQLVRGDLSAFAALHPQRVTLRLE